MHAHPAKAHHAEVIIGGGRLGEAFQKMGFLNSRHWGMVHALVHKPRKFGIYRELFQVNWGQFININLPLLGIWDCP